MSYSSSDLVDSIAQCLLGYDAPYIAREDWEQLSGEEIGADEWEDYLDSEEGLRVIAERVSVALSQRRALLEALEKLLAAAEGAGNTWDAMNVAREAIKEARA